MIHCKIANLITKIPAADGLEARCREYITDDESGADIIIRTDLYRREKYDEKLPYKTVAYMESAYQFYLELVNYNGFYLHSSAIVMDGRAYLFSGPSGVGKSTHTGLWQELFGAENARIINDDKPALRMMDGQWIAYGTPWCGKDGININESAPVAGVCFLKQGEQNSIRRMSKFEAMQRIIGQTIYKFNDAEQLDKLLKSLEDFLDKIPVYELENVPEPAAAQLSYETMCRGAKEAGL